MNKPHDHLFKSTFSDKQIARDYIQHFHPSQLTSHLDLNSLELSATSYVDSELKESLSDVVYFCKYGEEDF
ncbi:MAG: Rpn family recombination-promoting nuclease/putative transposase [Bacteroidota bacterium]